MRTYRLVAIGALLIVLGIQLFGFKLALDAVGWLVVIIGLNRLARQHRLYRWARIISGLALLATFVFYLHLQPLLTQVCGSVAQLCLVVFAFLVCGAISEQTRESDREFSEVARIVRWTALAMGLLTYGVNAAVAVTWMTLAIVAANLLVLFAFVIVCWLAFKRLTPAPL